MSDEKKVDTPSTPKDQPTDPSKKDTPTNNKGGEGDPSKVEKTPTSVTNQILETNKQILENQKEITGRLTKVEQRSKGKTTNPSGKSKFTLEQPSEDDDPQPSLTEQEAEQDRELAKVERGVTKFFRNEEYQKVLDNDKTLSRLLDKNPLGLLDEMPVDAEDALNQIEDILKERVKDLKPDNSDGDDKDKGGEGADAPPRSPAPAGQPSQDTDNPTNPQQRPVKSVKDVATSLKETILGGNK